MKKFLFPIFIVVALVQWMVPGKMIWTRQEVLNKGKIWRFEAEPVDPADPFRGRYIILNFKEDEFREPIKNNDTLQNYYIERGDVYVLLANSNDGFAKITGISKKEPAGTTDYLMARVRMAAENATRDTTIIYLEFPFEEFYMDEYKAPKAEKIYNESARDTLRKTYAVVKAWKGKPVLEDVFIDNKPIKEWIEAIH